MSANDTTEVRTAVIDGKSYDVVGVYVEDTDSDEIDWYDIFDSESGNCINEGNPFYEEPSDYDIRKLLS